MSVSRRRFLQHGAFAAAACAASPLLGWGGQKPSVDHVVIPQNHPIAGLHGLSRESFTSLVGSSFKVSPSSGNASPVWLRLGAVHELSSPPAANVASMAVSPPRASSAIVTTGFMLQFIGPGTHLPQETYVFEHEKLGKFSMFIVPGVSGHGSYTAVFNLLNGFTPIVSTPPSKDGGPTMK